MAALKCAESAKLYFRAPITDEQDNEKMPQPLPSCVYVLRSLADNGLYIGFTTDLDRRLKEHNAGLSPATFPRRPFELLFCECYLSKRDA